MEGGGGGGRAGDSSVHSDSSRPARPPGPHHTQQLLDTAWHRQLLQQGLWAAVPVPEQCWLSTDHTGSSGTWGSVKQREKINLCTQVSKCFFSAVQGRVQTFVLKKQEFCTVLRKLQWVVSSLQAGVGKGGGQRDKILVPHEEAA